MLESGYRVYEPNQKRRVGFFKTWYVMVINIIKSKDLIIQLFKRDFLAAYKKSFMGIAWVLLSPLFGVISWVFMNKTGLLNPGDVKISYTAYVLLGSSIWGLFMSFYSSSSQTLNAGISFILQVKYPHEALLVKQVAEQLSNFLLSFVLTLVIIILLGVVPSWKIIFFPLMVLPLFFMASSIGLVVSVIGVVAPDIQKVATMVMTLGIYTVPVIYSNNVEDATLQLIIKYNPLSYLITGMRDIIIDGTLPGYREYFMACASSIVMFLASWRFFFISEEIVIEKMI